MSYELLDSGGGRKLERIAGILVDRQAPAAVWRRALPDSDWMAAEGVHVRSDRGGGSWTWRGPEPESWQVRYGGLDLLLKPTPFGHIGLFAEQASQWTWLRERVAAHAERLGRPPRVLNLFAYTGGSSLACAQAGAEVTHIDAARGVVEWARRNARLCSLSDRPIRWIAEDARRFVERAARREERYDALVLDPPSFGRGLRGEVWKIEEHLPELLDLCRTLLPPAEGFVLLSAHTPGWSPIVLGNVLDDHFGAGRTADHGEMTVPEASGRELPAGAWARFG